MLQNKKILVIDDDMSLCQMVKITFDQQGSTVRMARNGREGLQQMFDYRPDLVLLDIRMPELDGWETCRQIRNMTSTPVIMLTTLHRDEEIVRGLDSGADDFVTKPFQRDVLLARVRAVLRRNQIEPPCDTSTVYQDDYLQINLDKHQVKCAGEAVKLTATEFKLLETLYINAGQVLSYQTILEKVWGWEYQNSIDYVHVYLSHLRRKIERNPRQPEYLITEHGVGCRFCKQ